MLLKFRQYGGNLLPPQSDEQAIEDLSGGFTGESAGSAPATRRR
jgi:hypothetical protein